MTSPLFNCLNAINYKNKSYKYNKKDCNGYMLMLWFSHDQKCLPITDRINEYIFSMPDEVIYKYLFKAIPKSRRYLKWDKGKKDKGLLKKEDSIIKDMMDKYSFSKYEATKLYLLYIKE